MSDNPNDSGLTKDDPLLQSAQKINPKEMRSVRFGGLRTTADNDHQDAGGDGEGTDHGD